MSNDYMITIKLKSSVPHQTSWSLLETLVPKEVPEMRGCGSNAQLTLGYLLLTDLVWTSPIASRSKEVTS